MRGGRWTTAGQREGPSPARAESQPEQQRKERDRSPLRTSLSGLECEPQLPSDLAPCPSWSSGGQVSGFHKKQGHSVVWLQALRLQALEKAAPHGRSHAPCKRSTPLHWGPEAPPPLASHRPRVTEEEVQSPKPTMVEGKAMICSEEYWPEGQWTWVLSQIKPVTLDRLGISLNSTKKLHDFDFWLP